MPDSGVGAERAQVGGGKASGGDISALEKAYAELLERRIAQLRVELENSAIDGDEPTAEGENKNKAAIGNDVDEKNSEETRPRVRKVMSVWDHQTDTRRDYEKLNPGPSPREDSSTVFRRIMDSKDEKKLIDEELTVECEGLKSLLGSVLLHIPPHQFTAKKVTFSSPFRPFVWQWENLTKACEQQDQDSTTVKEAREDLRQVLTFLETSDALQSYFSNRASQDAGDLITFDYIWTIFPPGTKVYAKPFMDELQMFEVENIVVVLDDIKSRNSTEILMSVAGFDWDGVAFRPYIYKFQITKFSGSRSIFSLPCFPVTSYDVGATNHDPGLRGALINRGKSFAELCTKGEFQYEYSGPVLTTVDESQRLFVSGLPKISTRTLMLEKSIVIVDNYSFLRSRRNSDNGRFLLGSEMGRPTSEFGPCPCSTCRDTTVQQWHRLVDVPREILPNDPVLQQFGESEERLLLCPPRVLGYSLQQKQWCQLAVEEVRKPRPTTWGPESPFEKELEMNYEDKQLLKALIQYHDGSSTKCVMKDAVDGKGRGLVILLHGPPGVGKTLTAETVALSSGRPLLSVSTAEIGIDPDDAEKNLRAIFKDASRWGAVLLIDEADVFLEERLGARDVQRNALVAVLLRVLEYYEGVIILTTNRIMALDVAVESRIHLAIQYRDLSPAQVQNIFQNFLRKIPPDLVGDREGLESEVHHLVKRSKLNGRQIRNIVMSALLLAQSQKSRLKLKHIETAMDATQAFLDCLQSTTRKKRGNNEAPVE